MSDPDVMRMKSAARVAPYALKAIGMESPLLASVVGILLDDSVISPAGDVDMSLLDSRLKALADRPKIDRPISVITCSRCGKHGILNLGDHHG